MATILHTSQSWQVRGTVALNNLSDFSILIDVN
jgi:hypothetical protein